MNFAEPAWLYVGLIVCPLLAVFFWWSDRRRRLALASFVSKHLLAELTVNFSPLRRLVKRVLFVAAAACFFVALARPQYGYRSQEVKRKGIDLVVAVDVSRSMLTQDVKPNRLERAKLAIRDLTEMADGDRLALIPFAGSAYVMCPPTLDYDIFLQSLDTLSPDMMPVPGTDLAAAMQAGENLLGKAPGSKKILLLLTDGEDLQGSALAEAKRAAAADIVIYTVGIGTPTGDLIPVPNENGGVDFLKDESGNIVKSRLDETMLKKIAELTGGSYALQSSQSGGVEKIYNDKIQIIPKQELSSRMEKIPLERFVWPLMAGMLLLTAEFLTRERKSQWFARKKTAALTMVLLALLGSPLTAAPDARDRQEFSKLAEQYKTKLAKHPDDPELNYNYGTANYKLGHYQLAAEALQKALSTDDLKLQNQAYYNYGNSLYRRGETTEKSDPDTTRKLWQQSVQAYQGALKLNDKDTNAKYNMDYVQKRLNELPPPQENKDQKDRQEQNKDKQNQQQQQNQQDQNQSDKDKDQQNQNQNQPQNSNDKNNQPDQDQNNQQNQQNQQDKGQQDQKQDTNGKPQAGKDQKDRQDSNDQPKQEQAKTGGMTKEQAQAALDSLKGEERPYNASMPNFQNQPGSQQDNKKDW
jgi:Ca-activated chloride channel family protein